jgi:hypothetical protein
MQLARAVTRLRDRWDQFEAAVGLVAAFILAFGPLTAAAFALLFMLLLGEWSAAGWAAALIAVTYPMACWLRRMAETALKQFRPAPANLQRSMRWPASFDAADLADRPSFAMVLASTLPRLPLLARLPLAIWWFAHFAAATTLIVYRDVVMGGGHLWWERLAVGWQAVVFCYLFHFAANLFLVLAVTALLGSPAATAGVWRRRFVIDALFTFPLVLRIVL